MVGLFVAAIVGLGLPVCPSATLLGIPCPGCGLTRATLAALRGDFAGALHFHPLVFLLAPLFGALAGSAAWNYVRGPLAAQSPRQRSLWTHRATTITSSLLVALVFAVWVARFFGAFGGPAPVVDGGVLRSKLSATPRR